MKLTLGPLMVGTAQPFRGQAKSAIFKRPVEGPVAIGPMGLEGDEQADLVHHGGADMAVHHYPHDHYAVWDVELGGHELLDHPGAFGENISTTGLAEGAVCIGDRFRLGTALVEVSQGRKPCWKIDHKFQRKGIIERVVRTARCGWYYRVLEQGVASEGDCLERVGHGHDGWSVERTFRLLHGKGANRAELEEMAELSALSAEWKDRARKLLG